MNLLCAIAIAQILKTAEKACRAMSVAKRRDGLTCSVINAVETASSKSLAVFPRVHAVTASAMNRNVMCKLPAKVKRTGVRQLTICLTEEDARLLETYRAQHGMRSWGAVVRQLIGNLSGPAGGARGDKANAPQSTGTLIIQDVRGERRLKVCGEFRGRLVVRNLETNRLSYIRPDDTRIRKAALCRVCYQPINECEHGR